MTYTTDKCGYCKEPISSKAVGKSNYGEYQFWCDNKECHYLSNIPEANCSSKQINNKEIYEFKCEL